MTVTTIAAMIYVPPHLI